MLNFIPQHDQMDCGPACLSMVASVHNKIYSLQYLRENSFITREGVSLLGISEASKKIGFETLSAQLSTEKLIEHSNSFPCILHWNQNHFVVLLKISRNFFTKKYFFKIADPAHGIVIINEYKFNKSWISDDNNGIALFLTPTDIFYSKKPPIEEEISIKHLLSYLKPHKKKYHSSFFYSLWVVV